MQVKHWILISFVTLTVVGCASEATQKQAVVSPSVTTDESPAQSAQSQPTAQVANATESEASRSGSFVAGEHPTQGLARIVTRNGQSVLELDQNFKTSEMGPDLVVVLHRSSDVLGSTTPPAYPLKKDDYTFVAPLQKFSGAQQYPIPETVKVSDYQSVAIWCRKFNATFGAAKLSLQ